MKHTVTFETTLPCTVQELFAFHADTDNLPLITPKDTSVKILKLQKPLEEGNEATLQIKKGLLSFKWELRFEKVESPHLIVDVATRSPFKYFRHEHHFLAINGGHSILRDIITFSLPFEPLSAVAVGFVKRDIEKMFTYRHAQTKAYLLKERS